MQPKVLLYYITEGTRERRKWGHFSIYQKCEESKEIERVDVEEMCGFKLVLCFIKRVRVRDNGEIVRGRERITICYGVREN